MTSVYEDSAGRLWVGTAGTGINVSDLTKSKFYAIEDTLSPAEKPLLKSVTSTQDSSGRIWVASNMGLVTTGKERSIHLFSGFEIPGSIVSL